jgi:hypothetical protein
MKFRWIMPIAFLIPLHLNATDTAVAARVRTTSPALGNTNMLHLLLGFRGP